MVMGLLRPCIRVSLPCIKFSRFHHDDSSKGKRRLLSLVYQPHSLWEENIPVVEPKPNELTSRSQKLMTKAGLIRSFSPGCFHYLPYTVRAMEKLILLIDKEMQKIGGQKIDMPSLCSAKLWRQSERWDLVGKELFRLLDRHSQEYCLGPTHEELVTHLVATDGGVNYKQLPLLLYQITRKFRDEQRPCFGLLRSREFYMKDMYTFDISEQAAHETYNNVCEAYSKLFTRLGLNFVKVQADTGSIGGKMSHEFHLPASVGEDRLMVCGSCEFAANVETLKQEDGHCPVCRGQLKETKGIEIGHTFYLGTKYSRVFNATCYNIQKKQSLAEMGCFGIGVSRLLAASIDVLSTEDEIHWPKLIAPYQVCLIAAKRGSKEEAAISLAEQLYDDVTNAVYHLQDEIIFDDRSYLTIGKRVKEAHMMGYPYVIVSGKKALESSPLFEVRSHNTGEMQFLSKEGVIEFLKKVCTVQNLCD
ncbi:probable proline--tRNA ligase, mitochondrial [Bombina bombina]|uniref:probable proline--tRNA ligase, mitochondrial n=1 Tax=Bombina bombina TaxID=8345 RepID=UPI00235A4B08|nr:probable proline--tRNA ligase, mitochondrial [Bombina bombina]XP_053549404.1 probable proline--tRNA ligase, mitochondrial [Bombina bombina]